MNMATAVKQTYWQTISNENYIDMMISSSHMRSSDIRRRISAIHRRLSPDQRQVRQHTGTRIWKNNSIFCKVPLHFTLIVLCGDEADCWSVHPPSDVKILFKFSYLLTQWLSTSTRPSPGAIVVLPQRRLPINRDRTWTVDRGWLCNNHCLFT